MNSGPECIPRLFELLVDTQAVTAMETNFESAKHLSSCGRRCVAPEPAALARSSRGLRLLHAIGAHLRFGRGSHLPVELDLSCNTARRRPFSFHSITFPLSSSLQARTRQHRTDRVRRQGRPISRRCRAGAFVIPAAVMRFRRFCHLRPRGISIAQNQHPFFLCHVTIRSGSHAQIRGLIGRSLRLRRATARQQPRRV